MIYERPARNGSWLVWHACTCCWAFLAFALSIVILALLVDTRNTVSDGSGGGTGTTSPVSRTASASDAAALAALEKFSLFATDISGADHTPLVAGETGRGFGAQLGPLRAARAMAIVNIAMVDSVCAGTHGCVPYTDVPFVDKTRELSLSAAVAAAARDTLLVLYPDYRQQVLAKANQHLNSIASGAAKSNGVALGQDAARRINQLRANDGSAHAEPAAELFESQEAGKWRRDPLTQVPIAMGGLWAQRVAPFVIERADQFRLPPPPALESEEYAMEYYEVKACGGDGVTSTTVRDAWDTFVGVFWGYDGTPSLCAPPRLYLQMCWALAAQQNFDLVKSARFVGSFAVIEADAGLAAWDSKYHYMRERPITAVRSSAFADNNELTVGDAAWVPLGAPNTNSAKPNFSPPFPDYPSGHATFGGALGATMREFVGSDTFMLQFTSDEYNGKSRDNRGTVRPHVPRAFSSATEIETENADSRIQLGIHFRSAATQGIAQGRAVAQFALPHLYRALSREK